MAEARFDYDSLPYSEEGIWALKKLDEMQRETGYSWNKLGTKVGVDGSIISRIKKGDGSYSNPEGKLAELVSYFKLKDRAKEGFQSVDFVETSITKEIFDLLLECQEDGDLSCISGNPGVGKTTSIMEYESRNAKSTILLTCTGWGKEAKHIMVSLAKKIGVQAYAKETMIEDIANKVKDGMLIIIDEAQFLDSDCIEALRSIQDIVKKRNMTLGIMFVGNNLTISRMKDGSEIMAQIESRTGTTTELAGKPLTKDDIKLVFPFLADEDRKMELELIYRISTNKIQGLRGANKLYMKAHRRAKKEDREIDYDFLIEVAKKIGLAI